MLQDTQTEVCAICFSEDDKESTCNYIDWISCSQCLMWVHAARANNLSTNEHKYSYCSKEVHTNIIINQ